MNTYLKFKLDKESFAVSVANVLEVLQKQNITKIPKTPPHILGILNFRGDIVPVVDSRTKFAFGKLTESEKFIVIVFEYTDFNSKKKLIAATADAVSDVLTFPDEEIKNVPEFGLSFDPSFVSGAVRIKEEFVLLLNIENVFSSSETTVNQEVKNF